ncbi:hypothetical protein [Dehalobacterium formicoaceticum]|uniref:hypothetical protein n=1 Tax=Dehalobacterium formicoaceticum TaxID=51515 RepID=UPI000B7CCAE5|nr:hypothetical protein [Dehalobacterium formicoaceticum]
MNYSIIKEIKNFLSLKRIFIWLLLMSWPFIYFMIQRNNYIFHGDYDVFTFMMEGIVILAFVPLAVLVYTGSFSQEIKNRFLVYTRLRIPLRKMLAIKFSANFLLTFSVFFIFVFSYFLFSFYIQPSLELVPYNLAEYNLDEAKVIEGSYRQHTFSQLLEYGPFTYGFLYSCWVGLNAAVYASLGFFLVLILESQFLALSIPFLLYLLGSFVLGAAGIIRFRFVDAVFPFSYMQQPIWTAFVPLLFIILVCTVLCLYASKHLDRLNNVI